MEDMLDSHEFLLDVFGDGDPVFGILPFNVIVFSADALLKKPGRLGIACGNDGLSA